MFKKPWSRQLAHCGNMGSASFHADYVLNGSLSGKV